MQVELVIEGKLTIADDEFGYLQAQGVEEVATALIRHGTDIKVGISEIREKVIPASKPVRRKYRKRR